MEHIDETALPAPEDRVVSATRHVDAPAGVVFELIADPSRQPEWDSNDNLAEAAPGRRVTAVGDVFVMTLTKGEDRENRVVEFEEGRRIAWKPSEVGGEPFGQLWRWEVEDDDDGGCRVTHTYDWTRLADPQRIRRALRTGEEQLRASIDRLAELAGRQG
ncbi:SRPBCC family protein [Micrococcus antarcticus]|uniref:SRPBCC family protein n=1 Tax=Micrococcus antarcticus TaxID=86171 RepID=UPI00384F8DB8